jgi:hypothetical protein
MRFAPIFLMSIYSSTVSLALADPPTVAATSNATATPAPVATTTTTTEQAAKPEVTDAQIKEMRSAGYKVQTRKGQTLFCKSEAQIGTRFESQVCGSYDEIKKTTQNSQDFTKQMQVQHSVKGNN